MTQDHWRLSQRILRDYLRDLNALLKRFFPDPNQPPEDFITELHALGVDLNFDRIADVIAQRMATATAVGNMRSWRAAAQRSMKSRALYEALQNELTSPTGRLMRAIVRQNAILIKSLPLDLARETTSYISRRQMEGVRSSQIAKELKSKLPDLTQSRIHLIARTETAKSEAAFTQARAATLGIKWAEWLTSSDQRVRKSHRKMERVLFSYDDLPNPELIAGEKSNGPAYGPGSTYNCRCTAAPLVDVDEVRWPHKVCVNDQLVMMSRSRFLKFAGQPGIAA